MTMGKINTVVNVVFTYTTDFMGEQVGSVQVTVHKSFKISKKSFTEVDVPHFGTLSVKEIKRLPNRDYDKNSHSVTLDAGSTHNHLVLLPNLEKEFTSLGWKVSTQNSK
jgi:hypothetical protein